MTSDTKPATNRVVREGTERVIQGSSAAPGRNNGRGRGRGRGGAQKGSGRPRIVRQQTPPAGEPGPPVIVVNNITGDPAMGNKQSHLRENAPPATTAAPTINIMPPARTVKSHTVDRRSSNESEEEDNDGSEDSNEEDGDDGEGGGDDDEEEDEEEDEDDDEDEGDEDDEQNGEGVSQVDGKLLFKPNICTPDGIRIPDVYHAQSSDHHSAHPGKSHAGTGATSAPNVRKSGDAETSSKTSFSTSSRAHMKEYAAKLLLIEKIRSTCPPEVKLRNFDEKFTPDMTYDELMEFYSRFKVKKAMTDHLQSYRFIVYLLARGMETLAARQSFVQLNLTDFGVKVQDQLEDEIFDGVLCEMLGESSAEWPPWLRGLSMLGSSAIGYHLSNSHVNMKHSAGKSILGGGGGGASLFSNAPAVATPLITHQSHAISDLQNQIHSLQQKQEYNQIQTQAAEAVANASAASLSATESETLRAMKALREKRQQDLLMAQTQHLPAPTAAPTQLPPPIREDKRRTAHVTADEIEDYNSDSNDSNGRKRKRLTLKLRNVAMKRPKHSEDDESETEDETEDDDGNDDDAEEEDDDEEEEEDEDDDDDDDDEESEDDEEESASALQSARSAKKVNVGSTMPQAMKNRISEMRQKAMTQDVALPRRLQTQKGPPPPSNPKAGPALDMNVNTAQLVAL